MDINTQVLLALGDIKERLGGLDAKIEEIAKLPPRVSSLEHDRSRAKGAAVAISAGVSALFAAGVAIAKAYPWGHS